MMNDELIKTVSLMVDINTNNRSLFSDAKKYMGEVNYAKEFKTIHVNPGRRTGKTSYIMHAASHMAHEYQDDCMIFVHDLYSKEDIRKQIHPGVRILTSDQINTRNFVGRPKPNIIFIDEPNLCFPNKYQLNLMYEFTTTENSSDQIYIMLG